MACTSGNVSTGYSKPTIRTCVTSSSGSTIAIQLEGTATEPNPFTGYIEFILEVESANADAWTYVTTTKAGNWANSSTGNFNYSYTGMSAYKGKTMRVTPVFYLYNTYTGKLTSSGSHIFYMS